jgi:hypothetical protein
VDLVQRYDAAGTVSEERSDTDGDCRIDTWKLAESGRVVRLAQDTKKAGRPTVLTHFDGNSVATLQELVGDGRRRPDQKLWLAADGNVAAQCLDTDGNGTLDRRTELAGGVARSALLDTNGDGKADQRVRYDGGQAVRLEADTNGDGKADVVQHLRGEAVARQCEDGDYDGRIDRCFEGTAPVAVSGETDVSAALGRLECGGFDRFWNEKF